MLHEKSPHSIEGTPQKPRAVTLLTSLAAQMKSLHECRAGVQEAENMNRSSVIRDTIIDMNPETRTELSTCISTLEQTRDTLESARTETNPRKRMNIQTLEGEVLALARRVQELKTLAFPSGFIDSRYEAARQKHIDDARTYGEQVRETLQSILTEIMENCDCPQEEKDSLEFSIQRVRERVITGALSPFVLQALHDVRLSLIMAFGLQNSNLADEDNEVKTIHVPSRRELEESIQGKLRVQIRWLIRRDMSQVLEIEKASFRQAWSEEDFLSCLRQRNCIGMVAEHDHEIVGFMVYELHKALIRILNLAVVPEKRRNKIGSQMSLRLMDKLSQQRRKEVSADVRASNLAAQQFFQACGFRATNVLREAYDDTREDAYQFTYQIPPDDDPFKNEH